MSLPAVWVEKIFKKLALVYGRDFLSRWEGQDMAGVMSDWGHELAGFQAHPEAIKYALENLPADRPPTVLQFRAICNRAPTPELPQLEAPKADPERVTEIMASLNRIKKRGEMSEAAWCAHRLREIMKLRPLTGSQRDMLKACEAHTAGPAQLTGEFTPVPADALPPGMRAA